MSGYLDLMQRIDGQPQGTGRRSEARSTLDQQRQDMPMPAKRAGGTEPAPVVTAAETTAINGWTIDEHVAYLARLSREDLATYRRALAFDMEALRRLDGLRASEGSAA